ncbi:MAG TPA: PIN domain-containing protein [Candidatus Binataceae bacterium]|nr:PIN domain-containing protein [Candidatus Binataceae bacterium]
MIKVLVDAGPLVALVDRSDPHHGSCRKALASLTDPLGAVWPAFTEAMYLLNTSAQAQRSSWEMLNVKAIEMIELGESDYPWMRELMWQYRDLPMDLADVALVRVAERERIRRIFTIDKRDFQIYRPHRLGRFEIIP